MFQFLTDLIPLGYHVASGAPVAIKKVSYSNASEYQRERMFTEANLMFVYFVPCFKFSGGSRSHVSHPNIIRLHHTFHDERASMLYLVLEYCPNYDLEHYYTGKTQSS